MALEVSGTTRWIPSSGNFKLFTSVELGSLMCPLETTKEVGGTIGGIKEAVESRIRGGSGNLWDVRGGQGVLVTKEEVLKMLSSRKLEAMTDVVEVCLF